jgi:hypothetical protein
MQAQIGGSVENSPEVEPMAALQAQLTALTGMVQNRRQDRCGPVEAEAGIRRRPPGITPSTSAMSVASLVTLLPLVPIVLPAISHLRTVNISMGSLVPPMKPSVLPIQNLLCFERCQSANCWRMVHPLQALHQISPACITQRATSLSLHPLLSSCFCSCSLLLLGGTVVSMAGTISTLLLLLDCLRLDCQLLHPSGRQCTPPPLLGTLRERSWAGHMAWLALLIVTTSSISSVTSHSVAPVHQSPQPRQPYSHQPLS